MLFSKCAVHYSVPQGTFLIVNVPNQCEVKFLFDSKCAKDSEIVVVSDLFTNAEILILRD